MSELAQRVIVAQDTLGRGLSLLQVMGQTRIIEELQAQRGQVQYQIAQHQAELAELQKANIVEESQLTELRKANLIAEQHIAIDQRRLELELLKEKRDENERAERAGELTLVKHLRNILAEATLELEGLRADLDGRATS